MLRIAIAVLLLALITGASAEPLRSHDNWAIEDVSDPAAWDALLAGRTLIQPQSVSFRPEATYAPTQDADDATQLIDGAIAGSNGRMWTDKRAVGWAYQTQVRVVIDLGRMQPVGTVIARLQGAINPDNTVPRRIEVALSADGDHFSPVRNLTEKTHADDNPALTFEPLPMDAPAIYAFSISAGYEARYVRLDLTTHGITICDEVAVLAGTGEVAQLPQAPPGQLEYQDNAFDRRETFEKMLAPGSLLADVPLRYAPAPNYRLTTDDADELQLTDGKLGQRTDERIWFEKPAVCWQGAPLVTLFADLGSVQPIDSVVFRLLGGAEQGGLIFPDEVRVLLSDNGRDYYLASSRHKRGLDDLSADAYDLPENKLAWVHNFVLPVGQKAQYIAVQVLAQKQFICSDEIAAVRGSDTLPAFAPLEDKRVVIVTSGVEFKPHYAPHPIATQPLRTKIALLDARSGKQFGEPCTLLLDLPDTVEFVTPGMDAETVTHDGRGYTRYRIPCARNRLPDFYLNSLLPAGQTDTLYMYGDSGAGPENERKVTWESIEIPAARTPKRLHVSLAWSSFDSLYKVWPDYFEAFGNLGFNAVSCFPRYWKEDYAQEMQPLLQEARDGGFHIIVNESPAGALSSDRSQPETKSQLDGGPSEHVCPSYRGHYYQKEHESFGQHAVWCKPDYIFYDIEAYWGGSMEAPRCLRCTGRYQQDGFTDWDTFRAAMGREIHVDMKGAIDRALDEAGIKQDIIYGSYRTDAVTKLNDGLFSWEHTYPELLQVAMPSLYVAGNQMAVADRIAAIRDKLDSNDIIPWLSTGTYGQYAPPNTRDMILETFANGARGITYYAYGDFDPLHFRYHAQAIDIVTPIEDIFVDGKPIAGVTCDNAKVKVCGMRLGEELAVLVSSYQGEAEGTRVRVNIPGSPAGQLWDLHAKRKIADLQARDDIEVTLDSAKAHLYYLGTKYADAVAGG